MIVRLPQRISRQTTHSQRTPESLDSRVERKSMLLKWIALLMMVVLLGCDTQLPSDITRVARNTDWQPYERDFEGVTMVLAPAECFMMGSEDDSDEQPVHEQCFDAPFWIDRTEVTQADFARLGGVNDNGNCFDGDNRPVECITWFEARDFCALRSAR